MKKLIRNGVFETNSSSCHSISIADQTKDFVYDTITPDSEGNVILMGGEFGWEWFKTNDALTKANYAIVQFLHDEKVLENIKEIIKANTEAENVIILASSEWNDSNYSYVDHDSCGIVPSNDRELNNFIFNKNSWLFGGNDNDSVDPSFYDVPLYKGDEIIAVKYKYELIVEGLNDKVPFKEIPTDEQIETAIYSLFSNVSLYIDGTFKSRFSYGGPEEMMWFGLSYDNGIDYDNQFITFRQEVYQIRNRLYEEAGVGKGYDGDDIWDRQREIDKKFYAQENNPHVRKIKFYVKEL